MFIKPLHLPCDHGQNHRPRVGPRPTGPLHSLLRCIRRTTTNIAPWMSNGLDVPLVPPPVRVQHVLDTPREPVLSLAVQRSRMGAYTGEQVPRRSTLLPLVFSPWASPHCSFQGAQVRRTKYAPLPPPLHASTFPPRSSSRASSADEEQSH